jgi:hypothetical protein
MKLLPLASCLLLSLCTCVFADPIPESAKVRPESFNWVEAVEAAGSTSGQMDLAKQGAELLTERMNQILADYRKLLESRKETEVLRRLEEMQTAWQKAADAEVAFIASGWSEGSGAKAVPPRARMECYLRHVKDLIEMKGRCLALNE